MSAFLTRDVVAAGQSVEYLIVARLCWGKGDMQVDGTT